MLGECMSRGVKLEDWSGTHRHSHTVAVTELRSQSHRHSRSKSRSQSVRCCNRSRGRRAAVIESQSDARAMLAGPKGKQWEKVRNWTQGDKRGSVSRVLSAPLPLLAQQDP
eukprot:9370553-Pyramimonas_sp.AAC.2